jgi:hypothetical protein
MFDSLDEQIRSDEHKMVSSRERMMRWLLIVVVSIAVFGGLYLAVRTVGLV